MRTIHKFRINLERSTPLTLPTDAIVRHVGVQYGEIMIWVELDDESELFQHWLFSVYSTGQTIPAVAEYVGSVQTSTYTWHVYRE